MKKGIISRNISLLMEHFGIRNESQLAKCVGMPQTTINKLITGVTEDPRISTLTPIIEYFKISLDTLLSNNPVFSIDKEKEPLDLLVPLITYDELTDIYDDLHSLTINNWPQWYPIPKQENQNFYAVQLNPQQLSKPFEQSSILIVKNEAKLPNNNYCIVKHLSSNSISIKKALYENGKQYLLALQTELPAAEFDIKHWKSLGLVQASIIDMSNGIFIRTGEHG